MNRSAPGFNPPLALSFPAPQVMAGRTLRFLRGETLWSHLLRHHLSGQLIAYLDRPFFNGFQQAAAFSGRHRPKFFMQLFGHLRQSTPQTIASFHPWSPNLASFMPAHNASHQKRRPKSSQLQPRAQSATCTRKQLTISLRDEEGVVLERRQVSTEWDRSFT
jgi:hypothetical protein